MKELADAVKWCAGVGGVCFVLWLLVHAGYGDAIGVVAFLLFLAWLL